MKHQQNTGHSKLKKRARKVVVQDGEIVQHADGRTMWLNVETAEEMKVDEAESVSGPFYVFLGDIAEEGKGKLFISRTNNPHLSPYARFL